MGACLSGDAECCRLLIQLGKPSKELLDQRDESDEALPPIAYAAHFGEAGVARALVQAGAATDVRGPSGFTPAQYAREAGHEALAAELGAGS